MKTIQEIIALGYEKYPIEREDEMDDEKELAVFKAERDAYIMGYLAGYGYELKRNKVYEEMDKYLESIGYYKVEESQ